MTFVTPAKAGVQGQQRFWIPAFAGMTTHAPGGMKGGGFSWHAALAVLFFVCIAYVSVFRSSDTLTLIRDSREAERLRAIYRVLGIGMVISPVIAVVLAFALEQLTQERSLLFFLEAVAVLMFGLYWLVKSWELRRTGAARLALEGKLQASSPRPGAQDRSPGPLVQLAPDSPADELLMVRAVS